MFDIPFLQISLFATQLESVAKISNLQCIFIFQYIEALRIDMLQCIEALQYIEALNILKHFNLLS